MMTPGPESSTYSTPPEDDGYETVEPRQAARGAAGRGRAARAVIPPEDRLPPVLDDDCPISALGHRDGAYFLLDAAGQVRVRRQRDLSGLGVLDLFLGDPAWLVSRCGVEGRNARRDGKLPWDNGAAAGLIMRACRAAGFFDPVEDVRGPGVWRLEASTGENGEALPAGLLAHLGDRLLEIRYAADGLSVVQHAAGALVDGKVYPASGEEAPVAATPATAETGRKLVATLARWNWQRPYLDRLLAGGWIALSYLAGAAPHRPTLWLVGDIEVGKSGLLECAAAVQGSRAGIWDDITASAIKTQIGRAARAVMVDELELKEDNRRAREIIELAKGCYKQGQGNYARAGADAHAGRLDAIFAFGAVEPPPIDPSEASRHCLLHLGPLPVDAAARLAYEKGMSALWEAGPGLRARLLARFADFDATQRAIRAAFYRRVLAGRVADTYTPLLTGFWILTQDAPPDAAAADELVDGIYEDLAGVVLDERRAHDQCWQWLLTKSVENFNKDARRTVGALIRDGVAEGIGTVNDALERYGVRLVEFDAGDGAGLRIWVFVANEHAGLRDVFQGSKWLAGGWATLLRRLQGAIAAPSAIRFQGARHRGTLIPAVLHVEERPDPARAPQAGTKKDIPDL